MRNYFVDCQTEQEIKLKYRALAFQFHPDLNPDPKAKAAFQELLDQYEKAIGKVNLEELSEIEWGEESLDGALLNPRAKIRLYCNFNGGIVAFQTLDTAIGFCIQERDRYEELKKRSTKYEFDNMAGRWIVLTAAEFTEFWNRRISLTRNEQRAKHYRYRYSLPRA